MHRAPLLVVGLLTLLINGCVNSRETQQQTWMDRFRSFGGPTGPDAVYLEYIVIQRPAGEDGIDREVWANVDEMVLSVEDRSTLEENGLRIGVTSGMLPTQIQSYISNPKNANGLRQRRLYAGKETTVMVNGPLPESEYEVKLSGESTRLAYHFEQAQWSMMVKPSLQNDGKVTLKITPEVQYQDKKHYILPAGVGAGWMRERPAERHDALAFDIELSPQQMLMIGSQYDRTNTVGHQCFFGEANNQRQQKLLILKSGRVITPSTASEIAWDPKLDLPKPRSPSLAQQATMSMKRSKPD